MCQILSRCEGNSKIYPHNQELESCSGLWRKERQVSFSRDMSWGSWQLMPKTRKPLPGAVCAMLSKRGSFCAASEESILEGCLVDCWWLYTLISPACSENNQPPGGSKCPASEVNPASKFKMRRPAWFCRITRTKLRSWNFLLKWNRMYPTQADLTLAKWLRITFNLWFSGPHLARAGITGLCFLTSVLV